MKAEEELAGGKEIILIAGKELECSPLSDEDLDNLTAWLRYKTKADAIKEAEFAEKPSVAREIKNMAAERALSMYWWDSKGLTMLLNSREGLIHVLWIMTGRQWKKDFFRNKFGTGREITDEQLENRKKVQGTFMNQNTDQGGLFKDKTEGNESEPSDEDRVKNSSGKEHVSTEN